MKDTVTAILIKGKEIVKQYNMSKKNAKKVVARGQGRWRDIKKEVLLLFPKDENGNYVCPEGIIRFATAPTMNASSTIVAVHQCIIEEEQLRMAGVKEENIPVLPLNVPEWVREQIRFTQVNK